MTAPPPPDVPDGWPRPDDSELEYALQVTTEALGDDAARPAVERLATHYDPGKRGAGITFLELPPVEPTTVTAADLHALTVLNAGVNALTTRRLLTDGPLRAGVEAALACVARDADLAVADRSTFEAMDRLSQLIKEACRDPWARTSNPWVTVAKLCSRKRPRLFPVRDRVVCEGLGLYGTPRRPVGDRRVDWQVFAFLIAHPDVVHLLERLTARVHTTHGLRCDAIPLRVLDVVLWTWLRTS